MEVAGIEVVEGHVKWLHEMDVYIQKSAKSENETLHSYCARLLKVNESENWYGSAEEEDDEDHDQDQQVGQSWKENATRLARKLNTAAMCVLLGDKVRAGLLLKQMDILFSRIIDTGDTQCQVFIYCKDVLRWKIGEENDGERLNRMWAELTTGKVEAQATVYFLQGMLGLNLKIDGDKVVELYLQAADLDPHCLVWCHHAYRSIRRNRGKGARQGGPSGKETALLERAYHLCEGQNAVIALDFGLLLKEKFWVRKHYRDGVLWSEDHETYTRCVEALENAAKISVGPWQMKSRLYLAEFLYFGITPEQDQRRGREMLLEMERDYPNSVSVLHKLGNLYRAEDEFDRARQCYQRALQRNFAVMPCIMDYVKLLKRQGDRTEINKVLEEALSPEYVWSDSDKSKLQMERDRMQQPMKKPWDGNLSAADKDMNWRQNF